jgi:hypothetical protein
MKRLVEVGVLKNVLHKEPEVVQSTFPYAQTMDFFQKIPVFANFRLLERG